MPFRSQQFEHIFFRFTGILLLVITIVSCDANKNEEDGFIDILDNHIHFKHGGAGEAILFLHGGYLDLDSWDDQVPFFINHNFMTIRYSEIGHGRTVSTKKPGYGFEIIDQLLDSLSIHKIHLVGLSWGAVLAVDYALNFPDKVEKLALISPGLNGWEYFQDSIASENYLLRQKAIRQNDTMLATTLFHQNWVVGPRRTIDDIDADFSQKSFDMITRTMKNHWLVNWSELDTNVAINRLHHINNETLIMIGDQDASDIISVAKVYENRIQNSELIELQGIAHSINMEAPQQFNNLLLRFLNN